jgi:hypothetical protein
MDVSVVGTAGQVTCRAPDAAGTITIPPNIVANAGTVGGSGFAVATRLDAQIAASGNASVVFSIDGASADVSFVP